jgi:hypothetical protein
MKLSKFLSLIVPKRPFHRTLIAASVCSALCGAGFVAPALADEPNVVIGAGSAENTVYLRLVWAQDVEGSKTFRGMTANVVTDTVEWAGLVNNLNGTA